MVTIPESKSAPDHISQPHVVSWRCFPSQRAATMDFAYADTASSVTVGKQNLSIVSPSTVSR